MQNKLYLLTIVLCCFSCSKSSLDQIERCESDVIPESEAIEKLNETIKSLYGNTKSLGDDYSVSVVKGTDLALNVKSEGQVALSDTLLYIVNFSNNSGCAILSATRKLHEDTFCVTESGNITFGELKTAFDEMLNATKSDYGDEDSLIEPAGIKFVSSLLMSAVVLDALGNNKSDDEDISEVSNTVTNVSPLLKTKWGQTEISGIRVFNRYTPNKAACCCVVTAVAQIMVCNKYPEFAYMDFDGKLCSWTEMENVYRYSSMNNSYHSVDTSAFDQVAHFVRELGKKKNVKVRYGDKEGSSSSAYADGAHRTFENYGYTDVDKHLGFGSKKQKIADKILRGGRSVYLDGYGNGQGHAWVLDGVKGNYYHINWGWYGMSDGYYSKGVFKTSQRNSKDSVDTQNVDASYHNFYKNFRMVTYAPLKYLPPVN